MISFVKTRRYLKCLGDLGLEMWFIERQLRDSERIVRNVKRKYLKLYGFQALTRRSNCYIKFQI